MQRNDGGQEEEANKKKLTSIPLVLVTDNKTNKVTQKSKAL